MTTPTLPSIPDFLPRLCSHLTHRVMAETNLSPCYAEDIQQQLLLKLLLCCMAYRPGKSSLSSFLWRRGRQFQNNLIREYRAQKRAELCHRVFHPLLNGSPERNDIPAEGKGLLTVDSRAELHVDIQIRLRSLDKQELELLLELFHGVSPSESSLGLSAAKRRRIHARLKRKFADLQFFLTR